MLGQIKPSLVLMVSCQAPVKLCDSPPGHAAGRGGGTHDSVLGLGAAAHHTTHFCRILESPEDILCSYPRNLGAGLGEETTTAGVVDVTGGTKKVSISEVCASGLISFMSGLEVI